MILPECFNWPGPVTAIFNLIIIFALTFLVMQIHKGYENLNIVRPVVTIGAFDGIHRGHKSVLELLVNKARQVNGESVVITFYPHPRQVLGKGEIMKYLTSLDEKIRLLEMRKVDHLVILEFDNELAQKDACAFIEDILVSKIGVKYLIVGFNHRFGREGSGDYNTIKDCASRYGLDIEMVGEMSEGENELSSSAIREALLEGRLDEANRLLGHEYFMMGRIVEGRKIGRKIGFPTANISVDDPLKLIPRDGVYAIELGIGPDLYKGVLSIGFNPTIDRNSVTRTIEANIFDFDREIYGEELTIYFRFRLRDEMTFCDLGQLARQIEQDKRQALDMLGT